MSKLNILAFAGSLRKESLNKKLCHNAVLAARALGAQVNELELSDFPLPIYDGDLEASEGIPENARKLKQLFAQHDALIIASPEYNGGITPVLKNTIDWISRPDGSDHQPFKDKWIALMAASPGGLGGIRALPNVRFILSGLGCLVIPDQFALAKAGEAFNSEGLLSGGNKERVEKTVQHLIDLGARR